MDPHGCTKKICQQNHVCIYIYIFIYIYIVYIILYQCNNQRMSSETSWGSNGWYIRNIKKYYNQHGLSKRLLTKKVENNWESTKKNTAGMKQLLFFQVLYCTSGLADVGGLNLGQAIMFTQPLRSWSRHYACSRNKCTCSMFTGTSLKAVNRPMAQPHLLGRRPSLPLHRPNLRPPHPLAHPVNGHWGVC